MSVNMQSVPFNEELRDESCPICLDKFNEKSEILGHTNRDDRNKDKKIYDLIHKKCLIDSGLIDNGKLFSCSLCKREINEASVFHLTDLTGDARWQVAKKIAVKMASCGAAAAIGALAASFIGAQLNGSDMPEMRVMAQLGFGTAAGTIITTLPVLDGMINQNIPATIIASLSSSIFTVMAKDSCGVIGVTAIAALTTAVSVAAYQLGTIRNHVRAYLPKVRVE